MLLASSGYWVSNLYPIYKPFTSASSKFLHVIISTCLKPRILNLMGLSSTPTFPIISILHESNTYAVNYIYFAISRKLFKIKFFFSRKIFRLVRILYDTGVIKNFLISPHNNWKYLRLVSACSNFFLYLVWGGGNLESIKLFILFL